MIHCREPDRQSESASSGQPPLGLAYLPVQEAGEVSNLYSDLFRHPSQAGRHSLAAAKFKVPSSPRSLAETGLSLMQVCDLILKQLYLQGNLLGAHIARHARLPFQVIDEGLRFLKDEKCIEVASGDLIGSTSYRFKLTELGRHRARESFE